MSRFDIQEHLSKKYADLLTLSYNVHRLSDCSFPLYFLLIIFWSYYFYDWSFILIEISNLSDLFWETADFSMETYFPFNC